MKPRWIFSAVGICGAALAANALELRSTVTAAWAENISRTSFEPTQRDAAVYSGNLAVSENRQLDRDWFLSAGAGLTAETVPQFRGLDQLAITAELALRRKFGLGPYAPQLSAAVAVEQHDFRDATWSGTKTHLRLTSEKRLTASWQFAGTATWEEFYGRKNAFDTRHRRADLESRWSVTERWQWDAGVGRLWGELTANAAPAVWAQAIGGGLGPRIGNYYPTLATAVSDVFGANWVSYRIDCRADLVWSQLTWRLDERTSLPLRYERTVVVNRADVRYTSEFWSLSVIHRF